MSILRRSFLKGLLAAPAGALVVTKAAASVGGAGDVVDAGRYCNPLVMVGATEPVSIMCVTTAEVMPRYYKVVGGKVTPA